MSCLWLLGKLEGLHFSAHDDLCCVLIDREYARLRAFDDDAELVDEDV